MRQKAIININVGGAVRKFQDCSIYKHASLPIMQTRKARSLLYIC